MNMEAIAHLLTRTMPPKQTARRGEKKTQKDHAGTEVKQTGDILQGVDLIEIEMRN